MSQPAVEVVHVGSASRDLTDSDARGWRLGGGVTYAALTTARLGLRTAALIGVDALASDAIELEALRDAGIDLHLQELPTGPVFRNTETPSGRVQIADRTGVPLPVPDAGTLPTSWVAAPGWSLLPVAGEVTARWADVVPAGASLCVGWQGMLRTLHAGERVTRRGPERSAILARADLVGVSRNDLEPGLSDEDVLAFLAPGASMLMTDGEAGGRLLGTAADGRPNPPIAYGSLPAVALDPTGAGDSFLAAYFATTLRPDLVTGSSEATAAGLRFAAAVAAGVVEGHGATTVPTLEAVRARLDAP